MIFFSAELLTRSYSYVRRSLVRLLVLKWHEHALFKMRSNHAALLLIDVPKDGDAKVEYYDQLLAIHARAAEHSGLVAYEVT